MGCWSGSSEFWHRGVLQASAILVLRCIEFRNLNFSKKMHCINQSGNLAVLLPPLYFRLSVIQFDGLLYSISPRKDKIDRRTFYHCLDGKKVLTPSVLTTSIHHRPKLSPIGWCNTSSFTKINIFVFLMRRNAHCHQSASSWLMLKSKPRPLIKSKTSHWNLTTPTSKSC